MAIGVRLWSRGLAGLVVALSVAVAVPGHAQFQSDYGRSFTVTAEPGTAGLGDSITLRFRLVLTERDLLTDTVPRPTGELPPGVRVLSVEMLRRDASRVFTGTAVIALYRSGKRTIPAFGVPWVQVVTGHRGVVSTEPAEVTIASSIPAGNPSLRDIREPDLPPSLAPLWGLLGALLVAAVAWRLAHRRRPVALPAPAVEPSVESEPEPDPYKRAVARLAEIEAEGWIERGEIARYYEKLADALRDYLEAAEEIPARERTTAELLWTLPPRLSEGGLRRRVQEVLGDADLVKFARHRPGTDEGAGYAGRARDLLERWHRAAPARGELDAVR